MKHTPILITGSHRSGSTWIGRVIESSKRVRYVHEPFNIQNKRGFSPLQFWFEYISEKSDLNHKKQVFNYLQAFYAVSPKYFFLNLLKVKAPGDGYRLLKDTYKRAIGRTLLKDPIALLSAEWIYRQTQCDVIISIRHPAAFVASIKVKDWDFNFNHFLEQPALMEDYLETFSAEIKEYAMHTHDIVDQAILLWNILYSVVSKYKEKYGERWYFVRHEDLSENPILEFEKVFHYLQLDFTTAVKDKILDTTTRLVSTEHKRDSKSNKFTWKQRLTLLEISKVKEKTFPLWQRFYSEADWG
ncbi:sulfotransferase domain-containing protein [Ulvibacter sp. MAR_2010_11]|uniref:sulfotransferase n=1 Tax=Ulvibacter sp. MAR_2010_11 TaxID=1250229 RepID=UPI000C2CA9C4|nr:sulfotransferase [Ulvibacter sp. MAR_2010_11]PKA82117.1 sulfotransferase domain-containing protein [Ulvibacter sp. MAR_2010_11]